MNPVRSHRGPWREFRALIATELFALALRSDARATYDLAWGMIDRYAKQQASAHTRPHTRDQEVA